ncbi:MAG: hypothetical protein O3C67_02115 [Cyanobacteria bacterium]|nr:hypothetical protein [Cyanobacteriota bacterium]
MAGASIHPQGDVHLFEYQARQAPFVTLDLEVTAMGFQRFQILLMKFAAVHQREVNLSIKRLISTLNDPFDLGRKAVSQFD